MGNYETIVSFMVNRYILTAFVAVIVVFASCSEQEANIYLPQSDLPVIIAAAQDSKTLTQDGGNVLWEDGDKIGLFVANSSTQEERKRSAVYQTALNGPSPEARFTKIDELTAGVGNGLYYAAYPVESISRWGSQNAMDNVPTARRCYVTIPVEQIAVKGGWDRKAGILAASSSGARFIFNHAVTYVKFTVGDKTTPFVKLTIQSTAGEPMAAEEAAILYGDNNTISVSSYSKPSDHVILTSTDDSTIEKGTYYIAFMPGSFDEGFAFTFENANSDITTIYVSGKHMLNPGEVANIGTLGRLPFKEKVNSSVSQFVEVNVPLFEAL